MLVSPELLPRLQAVLPYCPQLKHIVIFPRSALLYCTVTALPLCSHLPLSRPEDDDNVKYHTLSELEQSGAGSEVQSNPPSPATTAIIMYTR